MDYFRICSWNVNGLRSLQKPLKLLFQDLNAHVICLQETKTTGDLRSNWACVEGYNSYFSHCNSRAGYSGVSIFCRDPVKPIAVTDGFCRTISYLESGDPHESNARQLYTKISEVVGLTADDVKGIDTEGRFICAFFPSHCFCVNNNGGESLSLPLACISIYVPRFNEENHKRLTFRSNFELLLNACLRKLTATNYVVISGDLNVYHKDLDHCQPIESEDASAILSSRVWLDSLLISEQQDGRLTRAVSPAHTVHFVDAFRRAHPGEANCFTCWSARTGARQTNYGVRLDYILIDERLISQANSRLRSEHAVDILGSDHCPVWAELPLIAGDFSSHDLPPACSKFWPQCQGKQLILESFVGPHLPGVPEHSSALDKENFTCGPEKKKIRLKQCKLGVYTAKPALPSSPPPLDDPEVSTLNEIVRQAEAEKSKQCATQWSRLLTGPKTAPRCYGHNEPCVLRTVKQQNLVSKRGRRFWVCARPQGAKGNPEARCNMFLWDDKYKPS